MKRTLSLLLVLMMLTFVCPLYAFGEEAAASEVQSENDGNILFSEDFQSAQEGQAIVSEESCLSGWTLNQANNRTDDSDFTVAAESGNTSNLVGKIYRETSNSSSRQMRMSHSFEAAVDGGVVEFEMRINKSNNSAREWDIDFYDSSSHLMQFRVDLRNSRLLAQSGTEPGFDPAMFFNESSGNRLTSTAQYATGSWLTVKIRMDLDRNIFDFYQNGYLVADDYPMITAFDGTITELCLGTARNMDTSGAELYIDDIKLTRISAKLTPEERVELTKEQLAALFASPLEEDVELPMKGVAGAAIEWSSDNEEVITSSGVINRLYMQEQTAKLTAKLTMGTYTEAAEFPVTVAAITEIVQPTAELMQKAVDSFKFSVVSDNSIYGVKDNLNLITEYNEGACALFGGADISWSSSSEVVAQNGTLSKTEKTEKVTLTAAFTAKDDESITGSKTFDIEVLPRFESYLYETFDTPQSTAGQTVEGWNGWTMKYPDLTKYRIDSFFTLERESSVNNFLQLYRTQVDSGSGYITMSKAFDEPLDGGSVSIKFRLKVNSQAKRLLVHLNDSNGVQEEITVDFGNNRIFAGQSGLFPHTAFGFTPEKDEWHMVEIVANYDRSVFSFYLDNTLVGENLQLKENSGKLASMGFGTTRNSANQAEATFSIDDLFVTRSGAKIMNDAAAEAAAEELAAQLDGQTVTEDIELSVKGNYKSTVIWHSSDENVIKVINGRGIVTRPDEDAEVTLTATIVRGNVKALQEITVSVPAFEGVQTPTQELVDKAVVGFTFDEITDEKESMITKDLVLPQTYAKGYAQAIGGLNITWKSSMPHVMTDEGKITKQKYDTFLTLTAEFSSEAQPELKKTREFRIGVLAEGEFVLRDEFDEAEFEAMYKTFEDTGRIAEGGVLLKEVYDGWYLQGGNPGMEMFTDTNLVYFPEDPYQTVFNYTRTYNYKSTDVPSTPNVTFTYKELGQEFGSGTLYISQRFYLTNKNSRITVMMMNTDQLFSSASINCNTTYGGNTNLPAGLVNLNTWHNLTIVVNLSGNAAVPHTYDVFVDGQKLNKNQLVMVNGYPIYALAISSVRTSDGPNSNWYVDDITIRHVDYDVRDDVAQAAAALTLPVTGEITEDIILPTTGENGTRIAWSSSDRKALTDGGKIYPGESSRSVTLTATVMKEDISQTKTFNVTVGAAAVQPCEVLSLSKSGSEITGAAVKNHSLSANAVLITKLYSRGRLTDVRVTRLSAAEGAEESVTFDKSINTADYLKYSVEAYVYDTDSNRIVSRIYS